MENLWLFSNLTKLQMDNNIIERIEGLDTLTKLTWLGNFLNNSNISRRLKFLSLF
jgi:Leucine-rich repeat (LRR) protein